MLGPPDRVSQVLEQQEELEVVDGAGLETSEPEVAVPGIGILGVDEERPNPDVFGDAVDAPKRVDDKRSAEPLALLAQVDAQPGEDDDRDVVLDRPPGGDPRMR